MGERKICCLSESSPLPRLGRAAQVLGCQENPCAGETHPSISWPNTKGCFQLPPNAISNPSESTSSLTTQTSWSVTMSSDSEELAALLEVRNARNVKFGALAEGSASTSFNLFMQPVQQIN